MDLIEVMHCNNLLDIAETFRDKNVCLDYLASKRWNGSVYCVFCGCNNVYTLKGKYRRYKCGDCRKQFSAIKGTIFENSPIHLQKWFMAIFLITTHKKGISSVQLASSLGVTQKTAWFMAQRIRYALKVKSFDKKLDGVIQCDETFVGGKNKNRHAHKKVANSQGRSFKDKTPVLGMLHTGGHLRLIVMPDTASASIQPAIKEHIAEGSIIVSDEWLGYNGLDKKYFHIVMDHQQKEFVRGAFHTNSIEGFWGLFKRGIIGVYHYLSRKHLQRYCDEFSFRYNNRSIPNSYKFESCLNSVNCRLTYKELINKNQPAIQ
ncbi:IS1595 family transposase [Chitinophaga caeni]|uniref:IS1595 family transposase n=1 Tax=Chitinophaga caeni TaxID=2029983 RepID=A0A291QRH5_9BACT|nr:IS1595 family transposase [Chitinophaga caeni]ATL46560.1 IS1595 family transposase [Chitinophaga caeni]